MMHINHINIFMCMYVYIRAWCHVSKVNDTLTGFSGGRNRQQRCFSPISSNAKQSIKPTVIGQAHEEVFSNRSEECNKGRN